MEDFSNLGLSQPILDALKQLDGKDIIGLAPTGSGKTAAFAIPILEKLWNSPQGLFACILAPTHELAYQISSQFEALGAAMGVRCSVIVGGDIDRVAQAVALAKKPHIIVATPGRLLDHLQSTKGFNLRTIKYFVLDEADRLLDLDFGTHIDELLKAIPTERTTILRVETLQRTTYRTLACASPHSPQNTYRGFLTSILCFPSSIYKEVVLVSLVKSLVQNSMIIFVRTIHNAQRLSIILRLLDSLSYLSTATQSKPAKWCAREIPKRERTILVATDVASRGLDIPHVDLVINYDMPTHSKDYIHRVGRTARAGRSGKAILIATQYDVELLQRLETTLSKKLTEWPLDKEELEAFRGTVDEAGRLAANELREITSAKKSGGGGRGKRRRPDDAEYQGIEEVKMLKPQGKHKRIKQG
ncbi:P-loop containing nucleoside triphosphate hydrolase protein [Mucidula mucida]|nr:P-loop containing nucleoside triphosphate hydrolase protein [Mucidula mucida]